MSGVAFIEGCPHVRGGLYEGFHCTSNKDSDFGTLSFCPFIKGSTVS